ncbi:MAG: Rpn family recombination-promoting nuclease/putative transposase [Lachnospiraceae bacterium]|nr:Rpn family recombination-promoting nuclease/putative transposase [Lachnospiraceae bacterium]
MKKTDKLLPVITIVVYYGEKPWDGAKTLHEMLDIPEEMKPYVNDYKMLLVEARKNDLQLHNINNRDLFSLLQIILSNHISKNTAKEKAIEYSRQNKTDRTVVMAVAGATNTKLDYNALGKGDEAMCTLFEEIAKENQMKGKAEGIIETGLECGLSENDILVKLQMKLDISLKIAKEYFGMFGKQK